MSGFSCPPYDSQYDSYNQPGYPGNHPSIIGNNAPSLPILPKLVTFGSIFRMEQVH